MIQLYNNNNVMMFIYLHFKYNYSVTLLWWQKSARENLNFSLLQKYFLLCIAYSARVCLKMTSNNFLKTILQIFWLSSLKISFNDGRHLRTTPKVPLLFLFTLLHYYTNIHSLTFIYKDKENLESAFAMLAQGRD